MMDTSSEFQSDAALATTENESVKLRSFSPNSHDGNINVTKPYKRRFWVLGIFSFSALFQCVLWILWGPLSESVGAAFKGWGSGTVAMMANCSVICTVILVVPCTWLLSTRGLRFGVLIMSSFAAVSTVMRTLPFTTNSDSFFTVMCYLGAIMNGCVVPMVLVVPPILAAVWFPPRERTTATAVGQLSFTLGGAVSYLQPLIVRSPEEEADPAEIRSDIARLMYIHAGLGVAIFIAILAYFPEIPPTPPSISSAEGRLDFKNSIRKLSKNLNFVLLCVSMILAVAVPSTWVSVLNYSLQTLGLDQGEAMWVGFLSMLCAMVSGVGIGSLTDLLYGHLRITVITLLVLDTMIFYWFFLLTWGSITVTKWQVFVSVITGFSLNASTVPLLTQMAVESAYPCSEAVITGTLILGMNFIGLIFLFLFLIPNIGYDWVTYILLGVCALSPITLSFVKESYSRTDADKRENSTTK